MKRVLLRNKKTGKIGELSGVNRIVVYEPDMPLCGNSILGEYDTLAKLNEEWEDYKIDPYIISTSEDNCICSVAFGADLEEIERAKECGLYFESKEEAEKAVEKLKAWKRLKDNGFVFRGKGGGWDMIWFDCDESTRYDIKDFNLLFGEEKEHEI